MSIKKTYHASKPECKVVFKLNKGIAASAQKVFLVGDFNGWNETETEMKPLKNGDFTVTLNLETGREYQFRYLVDSVDWINEPEADKYIQNIYHSENSVITI